MNIRGQFPQLHIQVKGQPYTYLDSAATTLKPQSVIDVVTQVYREQISNVHRGAHFIADQATTAFEETRSAVGRFIGAAPNEIVFTRGTTEGINLLAHCLGTSFKPGDEVVLTEMEHHSNIVPWYLLRDAKGIKVRFAQIDKDGDLDLAHLGSLLNSRTKLVSFTSASNVLGTVNPVAEIVKMAKTVGATTLVDAAQSAASEKIDVKEWGCDFLVFSGHKVFAPFSTGVVYGRAELLDRLPPYQGGGSMIESVDFEEAKYLPPPQRFEAGTPAVAEVIGLKAALDFVTQIGWAEIQAHENTILDQAQRALSEFPGLHILGAPKLRRNILSFYVDGTHPSDIGQILDQEGIAIRTGHLCTLPLLKKYNLTAIARASFSIYSNEEDIVRLVRGLKKCQEILLG